jgi:undecaprenyl-diphosphatase
LLEKNHGLWYEIPMVFKSIILGIIQGLTEFLPVSSSGHLVLFEHFLGFEQPGILFEVLLHFATLIAIFIVFWKRISRIVASVFRRWSLKDENFVMLLYLSLASVPAALVGIFLKHSIETLFSNTYVVAIMLLVTGSILFSTRFVKRTGTRTHNPVSSVVIGITQACAIIPGISRSGATISAGLWSGISREAAAEFSFILAIPAICGALLLHIRELGLVAHEGMLVVYLAGGLAAFLAGYASLVVLLRIVKRGKLHHFAYYCWAAGIASIALGIFLLK